MAGHTNDSVSDNSLLGRHDYRFPRSSSFHLRKSHTEPTPRLEALSLQQCGGIAALSSGSCSSTPSSAHATCSSCISASSRSANDKPSGKRISIALEGYLNSPEASDPCHGIRGTSDTYQKRETRLARIVQEPVHENGSSDVEGARRSSL